MDEKRVDFSEERPSMEVRLWIVVVTFLYVFTLLPMDGWMDRWMKKELVFLGIWLYL